MLVVFVLSALFFFSFLKVAPYLIRGVFHCLCSCFYYSCLLTGVRCQMQGELVLLPLHPPLVFSVLTPVNLVPCHNMFTFLTTF